MTDTNDDPPSEILPGQLYMGRHQQPGTLTAFDVVIGVSKQKPVYVIDHPHAIVIHVPLQDEGPPTPEERVAARAAAQLVNQHIDAGKKVYVSCSMGQNRSGWVVGLALRARGYSGVAAVLLMRERRSYAVLNNEFFERDVKRD
jgi:hypothetical protein